MLVSTVTARILSCSPFASAAASMIARSPCTVRNVAPERAELPHGRRDRGGNVVELQVREDFLVARDEPVEQLEVVPRRRELEPDLVERDAVAERA